MIFDILEAKLAATGLVSPGVTLFRSFMPAECPIGVMTRVPLQGIKIDINIPGWHRGSMQVVCRHTSPSLGKIFSDAMTKALIVECREHHPATAEHAEVALDLFFPETMPIFYPRLVGNEFEWSQTFRVVFGVKPSWL